ncbi:MAG TPA: 2-oxoglutarate dehydrogenase, E2 component, dihydrolipoamide succinyltransferase, partial [Mycobacterium sp.]|nr:2-oxoglutarate dehydrogenase, E2 component, dihydrolipoamide succinyltransferase [Mycobacterium sp.]
MAFSVQMPALGESVTEGTVTRWLKQEGDTVELDEPLVEVSTDKVDTEIPSPAAGVLTKIIAQEDDTVEVGGELALIGDASEAGAPAAPAQPSQPEPQAAAPPPPEPEPQPAAPARPEPQPAAPAQQSSGGSATPVLMPELGESVTEGTVTRWLKKVGDSVQVDDPLVEVSTDKVDTEIPSPVAGILLSITAEEDDTVPVGGELARIGAGAQAGAPAPAAAAPPPPPPPPPPPAPKPEPAPQAQPEPKPAPAPAPKPEPAQAPPAAQAEPAAQTDGDGAPYVTPLVRKLATENKIDLAEVTGTGVGGRIRKQDVLAAAEQKAQKEQAAKAPAPAAPAPAAAPASPGKKAPAAATPAEALAHLRGTTQKASRIRQITATKTRESLQATAQLTQTHEVDMTKIVGLRAKSKA